MVIGITGGIGSGKSTVSTLLSEILSAPILDADKISKTALKEQAIIEKIKQFFGASIFDSNNLLNKEQLSKLVFSSEKKLIELNNIIHPFVMKKIADTIKELSTKNEYILLDVPLPNSEFIHLSDKIIVVVANDETRIKRAAKRLNISEEDVKKRMEKQMPISNYVKLADHIIKNNGTVEELKNNLYELCEKLK